MDTRSLISSPADQLSEPVRTSSMLEFQTAFRIEVSRNLHAMAENVFAATNPTDRAW
jgi:hypothetical protein